MPDTTPAGTAPAGTTTAAVAGAFLQALGAGDLGAVAACFAPDVDWYIPGNEALAPWLGRRARRDDVPDYFRTLRSHAEPISLDVEHVLVDGEQCVVVGHLASRMVATGRTYASMFCAHLTVRDGQITRYRVLEDSWALVEALTP